MAVAGSGMSDTREFLAEFGAVAQSAGSRRLVTPTVVIGSWRLFVELCEEGYGDNIEEFDHDLSVRRLIDRILQSPMLQGFEQMDWVRAEIEALDARYRALLIDLDRGDERGWWERGIPRLAGPELAGDFAERYGVGVEVVD
ncbi:hypothetical protein GCM10029976_093430 [Kribbella albertanoniae]|uniref:Uncharacterized protein n=1 Tax=Kribbella albertanoniae TaxID=1266829 RepID=A0A4R4P1Z4_9ACTN|nr:hypothetical protein [Kribbella albertanoniae]TDC14650.1 hypothetical protein E1261_41900 [Kribbella albertanoniae]